jgi:PIN like domain
VKFFFDNNLAPKLARGLHEFVKPDHEVVHLKARFPGETEDEDWMRGLMGEAGLVIVTADINIGKNPHEVRAWKEVGHTIIFLKPGWVSLPFWTQAYKFTKCFPTIIERALRAEPGDSFVVAVNGKIEG